MEQHSLTYVFFANVNIDFVVVSTGILEMYGELLFALLGLDPSVLKKMKLLKMGRVFRPLKMISNSPSLQVVMSAILKAIGPIMNIFILLIFFIIVFAIVGVEFYAGGFHSYCRNSAGESYGDQICKFNISGSFENWTEVAPFTCPPEYTCQYQEIGPYDGITKFDDIIYAMLAVFQILTLESWIWIQNFFYNFEQLGTNFFQLLSNRQTSILYMANDGTDSGNSINYTVFILMVVIGSLFMLNLVIGVLSGEFSKERELVEKRGSYLKMKEEKQLRNAMQGYLDWIEEGERITQEEERQANRFSTVTQKPPTGTINLSTFMGDELNDDKVSVG